MTVTVPGKLVLLGEYVVTEGAPALVAAMDRRARVQLTSDTTFRLSAPALRVQQAPFEMALGVPRFTDAALDGAAPLALFCHLMQFVHATVQARDAVVAPCHIELDTAAFFLHSGGPKLGLGSSAALTTALVTGLLARAGLLDALLPLRTDAQRHSLMTLAQAAHASFQAGAGSGVDVAASVWGGLVRFTRERSSGAMLASRLQPLAGVHVRAVWAGESASTPGLLAQVAAFKEERPQQYWEIYEKLGIYANAGVEFWALGNGPALLTVVDAFYAALGALGDASGAAIVTPAHADIHRIARAAGCFYKPSGAGGGDLGLAFCPSAQRAERLTTRLSNAGHPVIPLRVDPTGIELDMGPRSHHGSR